MADRNVKQKPAVGDRFGRWVICEAASPRMIGKSGVRRSYWLCRCRCGNEAYVGEPSLKDGRSTSCGCFNREQSRAKHITHGHTAHGRKTPEFGIYHAMRGRCQRPKDRRFKDYGARGIGVDPVWDTYEGFYESMGPRPSPRHQLDRKENDKGYGPNNCHWVLPVENMANRRNTRMLIVDGVDVPLAAIARQHGIPGNTLRGRIEAGWGLQRALTSPVGPTGPLGKPIIKGFT